MSSPPASEPAAPPTAPTAPQVATALARAGPAGIVVVRIVSVAGATTAAPSPWHARAAISSSGVVASPPARPATANTVRPATNVRLRP